MTLRVVRSNLNDPQDQNNFRTLLRTYIIDNMGRGYIIVPENPLLERSLQGVCQHPTSRVYFGYVDEVCAGMAVCFEVYSTFQAAPVINIHDMIVAPKYRRYGVAREILNHIEQEASLIGVKKLTLEVRSDNFPAQNLYRRLGFRECAPLMYFWVKQLN